MKVGPMVHLVDDDAPIRRALRRLLAAEGWAVTEHASADEFLEQLDVRAAAIAILDVAMPGLDGIRLHDALVKREACAAVIFLTAQGDIPMTVQAMKNGAVDFLTKPVDAVKLIRAVQAASAVTHARQAAADRRSGLSVRYASLTVREREVMAHVIAGHLNKQIAALLGTGEQNVKIHRGRVMRKLGVESVADLVRVAAQLGLDPKTLNSQEV